jgi:hypothetical protein
VNKTLSPFGYVYPTPTHRQHFVFTLAGRSVGFVSLVWRLVPGSAEKVHPFFAIEGRWAHDLDLGIAWCCPADVHKFSRNQGERIAMRELMSKYGSTRKHVFTESLDANDELVLRFASPWRLKPILQHQHPPRWAAWMLRQPDIGLQLLDRRDVVMPSPFATRLKF